MGLVDRLYISLAALAIGAGCATGSVASRAESRLDELRDTYKCVAVGVSSFNDPVAARKDALHRAKINYVKQCLGGSEADLGIINREPVSTEILDENTAVVYNNLERK